MKEGKQLKEGKKRRMGGDNKRMNMKRNKRKKMQIGKQTRNRKKEHRQKIRKKCLKLKKRWKQENKDEEI